MKKLLIASLALNIGTLSLLLLVFLSSDSQVVKIHNAAGTKRTVQGDEVRRKLIERHGVALVSELTEREIVRLGAEESKLQLDVEELELRWHLAKQDPNTRAKLDGGEQTENEVRQSIETLVLLDQLSLHELDPDKREAAFEAYYEDHKRDLEQLHLRHILLDSEKTAQEVAERLVAGVEFGPLAQRFSLDPLTREQGGDLGWKRRSDLQDEFAPLLFLIPQGRVSRPLASKYGWHIFLVEERRADYAALRTQVRRAWCEHRRADTLYKLKERFKVEAPTVEELNEQLLPLPQRLFDDRDESS